MENGSARKWGEVVAGTYRGVRRFLPQKRITSRDQLAILSTFAKGLRPSQTYISAARPRSPVNVMRPAFTAWRTVSRPIQITVMVRRSVET